MRIITLIFLFTSLNVHTEEVNDPLEDLNRKTYEFNEKLDSTILKPTAELYSKFPPKVKQGVTNFFNNLEEIDTSVNQLLQGKPKKSLNDFTRFVINSTIGIGGLFEVKQSVTLKTSSIIDIILLYLSVSSILLKPSVIISILIELSFIIFLV